MDKKDLNDSLNPVFYIKDLETLKVVTDPLRLQILEVLSPEPQTVNQVAGKLGLSGSRLYYHFNMLEEHGLIKVVETRTVNNIIEKVFWVSSQEIEIEKGLLSFTEESGQENLIRFMQSSVEALREDIIRSLQARKFNLAMGAVPNPRQVVMENVKKRLKDETYRKFQEKVKGIIKEFYALEEETGKGQDINVFSFSCFLYPSFYYDSDEASK